MASGLLSLKWNHHRSTFLHVLATIRQKESYCDLTLACSGKFYLAHKLVLSTCSEYFEQMFERTQCKHPVIVLKDIGSDELEALLSYMYDGEVNVLQENLSNLIKAAECLKIKGLAVADHDPSEQSSKDKSSSNSSNKDVNRSHSNSSSNYHSDNSGSRQFRNNSGVKRPMLNKQDDGQPLKRRRPAQQVSSPVRRLSNDKSNSKDRSPKGEDAGSEHGDAGDDNNSVDAPVGADDQVSSDVPEESTQTFAQGLSEDTGVKAEPVEIIESEDHNFDQQQDDNTTAHDTTDNDFTEEKFSGGATEDGGTGDPNSLWGGGDPSDLFSQPSTSSFSGQDGSGNDNNSNNSSGGKASAGPVVERPKKSAVATCSSTSSSWLWRECSKLLRPELLSASSDSGVHQSPTSGSSKNIASMFENNSRGSYDDVTSTASFKNIYVGADSSSIFSSTDSPFISSIQNRFLEGRSSDNASSCSAASISLAAAVERSNRHLPPLMVAPESLLSAVTGASGGGSYNYSSYNNSNDTGNANYCQQDNIRRAGGDGGSNNVGNIFVCSWPNCNHTSSRREHFKIHIRKHTGEKPYMCIHCDYRCNQKGQLKNHVIFKHSLQ
uniref:Protein tramtrack, beta isoform-like n=1 Tax=Hirondellea gigas TaxID=1518452 RepID=A0A2P2I0H5_9CRUS